MIRKHSYFGVTAVELKFMSSQSRETKLLKKVRKVVQQNVKKAHTTNGNHGHEEEQDHAFSTARAIEVTGKASEDRRRRRPVDTLSPHKRQCLDHSNDDSLTRIGDIGSFMTMSENIDFDSSDFLDANIADQLDDMNIDTITSELTSSGPSKQTARPYYVASVSVGKRKKLALT
jgi:hypothetical protein